MTEQNEGRPLTRRELRLREMEATGAIPVVDEQTARVEAAAAVGAVSSSGIEIPLFDEHGRMRSRRELRELREQAEAALQLERGEANETEEFVAAEPQPEFAQAEPVPEPEVVFTEATAAPESEAAVDPLQAYLSRLGEDEVADESVAAVDRDADESVSDDGQHDSARQTPEVATPRSAPVDPLFGGAISVFVSPRDAEDDVFGTSQEQSEQPKPVEAGSPASADTFAPSAPSGFSEFTETSDLFVIQVPESLLDASDIFESPFEQAQEPSNEKSAEPLGFEPEPEPEAQSEAFVAMEPEAEPSIFLTEPQPAKSAYSFPDIAPLDEERSVFDDPAIRMMGAANAQQSRPSTGGDFDDLINRAVAQEGAAGTTNTSALILPNMPEADSLAGPLGETGELYITGSIDLPKSLGETGGHSALHDSVEIEPLDELGELGFAEAQPSGGIMAPVSASRAVSARAAQGSLVAEAAKDKSKMPIVLIATGGVLVVGATGLIIWAAASGLFG